MLKADTTELNNLATALTAIGTAIAAITVDGHDDAVATAMPGSTVPYECARAGIAVGAAFKKVGCRMKDVAAKVAACAQDLHTTDIEFAQKMHALDFHA